MQAVSCEAEVPIQGKGVCVGSTWPVGVHTIGPERWVDSAVSGGPPGGRKSMAMHDRRGLRFSLGALMIVVTVLAIVGSVAAVSFMRARETARRSGCMGNLRFISDAKNQYALEFGGSLGMTFAWSNVALYAPSLRTVFCPDAVGPNRCCSNSYELGRLDVDPVCKIHGTNADGTLNHSLSYVPE